MATGKRYYWLKLKEDFFADDGAADFMMSQNDGANYVVLYQMLCLKAINTNGALENRIGEMIIPFDAEKIRRTCKYFTIDTIMVALELYKALGLMYEDINGTLILADMPNMIGSETNWASQKQRQRLSSKKPKALEADNEVDNVHPNVHHFKVDNVPTDIRYKDTKILDTKNLDKKNNTQGAKADAFAEFAADDAALLNALKAFEEMRKKIRKPMTDRAKTMLVNKLNRKYKPYEWIDVIEQSILNSWSDIYPLKADARIEKPKSAFETVQEYYQQNFGNGGSENNDNGGNGEAVWGSLTGLSII